MFIVLLLKKIPESMFIPFLDTSFLYMSFNYTFLVLTYCRIKSSTSCLFALLINIFLYFSIRHFHYIYIIIMDLISNKKLYKYCHLSIINGHIFLFYLHKKKSFSIILPNTTLRNQFSVPGTQCTSTDHNSNDKSLSDCAVS